MTISGLEEKEVRKLAPWLPAVLLHFGKQSGQTHRIVESLVEQADTLLSNRVSFEIPKKLSDFGNAFRQDQNLRETIQYHEILYQVLDQLVQERGQAIVILDAIDEISFDGTQLSFLPKQLPEGVKVLLTTRPYEKLVRWINNYLKTVKKVHLEYFDRTEIPLVTRIDDQKGPEEHQFNERVWKASGGWPIHVAAIAQDLRNKKGNIQSVNIYSNIESLLRKHAKVWETEVFVANQRFKLREILFLLAIFEPVIPLRLEEIQSYLEFLGIELEQPDLYAQLENVATQVEGLDTNQIKLRFKIFADFVCGTYFSLRDVRRRFKKIVQWLIQEKEEIPDATIASFLSCWTDSSFVKDAKCREVALQLLSDLSENHETKRISHIVWYLWKESGKHTPLAKECLHLLKQAGDFQSLALLSFNLISGDGVEKHVEEGEKWLRIGAESGCSDAMYFLSICLLKGLGMKKDGQKAEAWLRKAAEAGHQDAMLELAKQLFKGELFPQNIQEGEKWLRAAAKAGQENAMLELGRELIEGERLKQDLEEGE